MSDLDHLADHFGILPRYNELDGTERAVGADTKKALLAANGVDVSSDAAISEQLHALRSRAADRWFPEEVIIESNRPRALGFGLGTEWRAVATDSGAVAAEGQAGDEIHLPAIPSGVYELIASASGRTEIVTLIVAPTSAPSLPELAGAERLWGVNAALYGLGQGGALGSFADLARFGEAMARKGASFLGVNPLHAFGIAAAEVISPYSPSTRFALNTHHIALDRIPGLPPQGEAASGGEGIDYAAHKRRHGAALERAWAAFRDQGDMAAFEAFAGDKANRAAEFGLYEAISEQEGADWRNWQSALRDADAAACAEFAAAHEDRIAFHTWLQWVAEQQMAAAQKSLRDAGMPLGLYLDLAVGSRRGGAESWCEREAVAQGVSVGAPPDHLSPGGQNWDLAAFAPGQLKKQRYRTFQALLRTVMRHAGVIRIDHVLGLNRSFWLPDDGSPGGYIRQPLEALTAIIRIEAERAGVMVIGEDLGLVPEGFREAMRGQGIYGYSVLQYEKQDGGFRDPASYDPRILACFGTHDTPTLEGYRQGTDIGWWQKLGWIDEGKAARERETRKRDVEAIRALAPDEDFSLAAHGALAASPAALVSVQLDDILGNTEAQNLPGTIDEHPNWRRAYGIQPDQADDLPGVNGIADRMQSNGRAF